MKEPKGVRSSLPLKYPLGKIRKYKARKEREGNSNLEKWQSWIESKSKYIVLCSP